MRVWCFDCPLRVKPAFKQKSEEEVATIHEMKRDHLKLPAGTEIIHPGQEDSEIYTLFSGWAFRFKMLPDGRRQILSFLLPGDLIGLQASMFSAALYGTEALTAVELCLLPRRRIWTLFGRAPELAFEITWLGARGQSLVDDNLTTVGRRNAAERVAALIISLYKRADSLGLVKDQAFEFPLSQQHIADALGLSLVHTNKTLRRLKQRGLFKLERNRLEMQNRGALEKLADYFDAPIEARPLL